MPIYRKCSHCGKKISVGSKCECELANDKARYKQYAKNRNDKDIQKIYSSTKWERVKEVCKSRQNGICLYSYYILNEIVPIDLFHHIIETKEDITKAYEPDNVIGVVDSVHKLIHSAYNQGKNNKRAMQRLLLELLYRYDKEMRGEGV